MAQKKEFKIETPRGTLTTYRVTKGELEGQVIARLKWNSGFAQKKKKDFTKAQEFVDSECLRYMKPFTPRRTGLMIKSATLGTVIGSGQIEYLVPYDRRQYYEHKKQRRWFETMKAEKKELILKGALKIAGS